MGQTHRQQARVLMEGCTRLLQDKITLNPARCMSALSCGIVHSMSLMTVHSNSLATLYSIRYNFMTHMQACPLSFVR